MPKQAHRDESGVRPARISGEEVSGQSGELTVKPVVTSDSPRDLTRLLRAAIAYAGRWSGPLYLTDLFLPLALLLWVVALRDVRLDLMNDYGLLPALPYTFFLSYGVLTVSFVAVLARTPSSPVRLGAHLIALVVMLHAVGPVVFARPQYAWVYKHIGVVSYISAHGSVNQQLDIYQNWPGFFTLMAWFNAVAGVNSAIQYAAWTPVYIDLLSLLTLGFALPAFTSSDRLRWLALFVFVAGNWVGQDYFAPQAFAFVLSLGLIAVLLRWFRVEQPRSRVAMLENGLARLLAPGTYYRDAGVSVLKTNGRLRALMLIGVNLVFAVIVVSHQLSPYMVLADVLALILLSVVRPRWLAATFAVLAVGFLLTRTGVVEKIYGDLFSSFNPLHNAHNQSVGWGQGLPGRLFAAQAARTLSVGIWGLALVGAIRRVWNGAPTLVPLALATVPAGLILVQDYGGEAIYRVFLFSLPWAAFLAAAAFAPYVGWRLRDSLRVGAILLALVGLFLPAYFGLDEINQVRPTEVQASLYYYDHSAPNSVLVLAAPSFPTRASGNYDRSRLIRGVDPNLTDIPTFQKRMLTSQNLPDVEALVTKAEVPTGSAYLVITTGMKIYCHVYSVLPDGSLDSLDQALARSPGWRLFYRNHDAVIYEIVGPATPARPNPRPPRGYTP
jgi:hypothetical protein